MPLQPLTFTPLFMERIWGGRRLETLFGKPLPADVRIGESWEIVDRPEAQSIVRGGDWAGRTLHDLWMHERSEVFGEMPDAPRFPLFLKLLDAEEKLSLQVHPPAPIAAKLGGEPKTECWYVAHAEPDAELYVGLKPGSTRASFEAALKAGTVADQIHRLPVRARQTMFLPSGRVHAIGAGNVLVEIQQNSDTTYRVFDWNRKAEDGQPRTLHLAESLASIDFDDFEPDLISPAGESLVHDSLFRMDHWDLRTERVAAPRGEFALVVCLIGQLDCAGQSLRPGEVALLPAGLADRMLRPTAPQTSLLRIRAGQVPTGS